MHIPGYYKHHVFELKCAARLHFANGRDVSTSFLETVAVNSELSGLRFGQNRVIQQAIASHIPYNHTVISLKG